MLSSAHRLLAAVSASAGVAPAQLRGLHALAGLGSAQSSSLCGCSRSLPAASPSAAASSWRHMSASATASDSSSQQPAQQQQQQPEASSASSAAPPSTPQPTGPTSEVVQQLTQASPTGRLLDLFKPSSQQQQQQQQQQALQRSRGHGQRSRPGAGAAAGGGGGAAAAAGQAQAAAAAAVTEAPLTADTDVLEVVMRAVDNCKPLMKVIQSKAGTRVVYQPRPLNPQQSTNFAVKWILQAAQKRRAAAKGAAAGARSMADALAVELLLAAQRKGGARARRDEVHKIALDNRANLRR